MRGIGLTFALLLACASNGASSDELPREVPAGRTTNPDGAAYPTDHIGPTARKGTLRGDRMPNLSFRAYLGGDRTKLETRSLADFYDPETKRIKLIHLVAVAYWCSICRGEMKEIAPLQEKLREAGVVQLAVLISGAVNGVGPSLAEFDDWHTAYGLQYDFGFDVRGTQLSAMGFSGVPWNALIDPRSMELLAATVGAPLSVQAYVDAGLEFVSKYPSSYPPSVP